MRETRELMISPAEIEAERGHRREVFLLLVGGIFFAVNLLALQLVRGDLSPLHWLPLVAWIVCAIAGHLILRQHLPDHDPMLLPLVLFLSGWGLIIIDRLQPAFADRQAVWLLVSQAALLFTAVTPYPLRWLRQYRYLILISGLLFLLATIGFGTNPSEVAGAPRLWLKVFGLYFQPSEVLKIVLVAFVASYLAENYTIIRADRGQERPRLFLSPRIAGPILLMWGLTLVILVWQRDLGAAALFFITFMIVLYLASGVRLILVAGAGLLATAGVLAYLLFDLVRLRVDIWINPWPEASDRAYQVVQSLMAVANGGVFGQGIGQGSPYFIPVAHSDFLFSALAEEFGLIGIVSLTAVITVFVLRGLRVALLNADTPFHSLFAAGLTTIIALQTLLIVGGALKIIPLTGVTLPFMSYGGSSLLASYIMVGFLLRLSSQDYRH
jgi:cell division protein FtsW